MSSEKSSSYEHRVEHLASGQVARFHAPEELLAFMSRMLGVYEPRAD
jgi:hypothetical protein